MTEVISGPRRVWENAEAHSATTQAASQPKPRSAPIDEKNRVEMSVRGQDLEEWRCRSEGGVEMLSALAPGQDGRGRRRGAGRAKVRLMGNATSIRRAAWLGGDFCPSRLCFSFLTHKYLYSQEARVDTTRKYSVVTRVPLCEWVAHNSTW